MAKKALAKRELDPRKEGYVKDPYNDDPLAEVFLPAVSFLAGIFFVFLPSLYHWFTLSRYPSSSLHSPTFAYLSYYLKLYIRKVECVLCHNCLLSRNCQCSTLVTWDVHQKFYLSYSFRSLSDRLQTIQVHPFAWVCVIFLSRVIIFMQRPSIVCSIVWYYYSDILLMQR